MIQCSDFVLKLKLLSHFYKCKNTFWFPNLSQFTLFPRGKIWFDDIGPCKRFDILQLLRQAAQQWKILSSKCLLRK